MWDCTLTSPRKVDGPLSVPMSPKSRRPKGESHWNHFACGSTPQELKDHPLTSYADKRAFKVMNGKLMCKECDDGILRTVAGHDAHFRVAHEGLEVYSSFSSARSESSSGGRVNQNIPQGRDTHRAKLLKELKALGVTAKNLHAEGYTLAELKASGFTLKDLLAIGAFSLEQLYKAGVTKQLKGAGLSIEQLRGAGYSLRELRGAGYSAKQLKDTLSTPLGELRSAGFQLTDLKEANFSLSELKELKRPGNGGSDVAFTLQDFIALGYTCIECKRAGFPLSALKSGYTPACLKVTNFTTKAELAEDGFPVQHLKLAGFSAYELRDVGVKPSALLSIGFSKAELKGLGLGMSGGTSSGGFTSGR